MTSTIRLSIENLDQLPDGGPLHYQARQRGFDIGRDQHLDWTLPDPDRFVSGRHCEIRFENDAFWLYDVSSNGTFLNGGSARVKSPHKLAHGDRLEIGHYILRVAVEQEGDAGDAWERPRAAPYEEPRAPGGTDNIWDTGSPAPEPMSRKAFLPPRPAGRREADFMEQYVELPTLQPPPAHQGVQEPPYPGRGAPPAESPFGTGPAAESPFGSSARVPGLVPGRGAGKGAGSEAGSDAGSEAGWQAGQPSWQPMPAPPPPAGGAWPSEPGAMPPDPTPPNPTPQAPLPQAPQPQAPLPQAAMPQQPMPQPAPPPAPQRQGGPAATDLLQQIAAGAGLPPGAFARRDPDEVAREVGAALRIVAEQVAVLLKARAAAKAMTKSSRRTMVSAVDNNPLKLLPSAAEALEIMFARGRPGYLDAQGSLEQAFGDLRTHEVATFSAMQKALGRLLDDLSPASIEAKVPSSTFTSRKARAWDLFVERWEAKTDPYENGMLDVFLAYFSEAYDEASRTR